MNDRRPATTREQCARDFARGAAFALRDRMRTVVFALLVTTACHTTMRSRMTSTGFVEEAGACDEEDVGPHDACEERAELDESRTVLVVAAAIAAIIAASAAVTYSQQ